MLRNLFSRPAERANGNISIAEILKGCEAGRMQSVGYMQVIPLLSDINDERIASPDEAEVSTQNYGSLIFNNLADRVVIVPLHAGYVVKQAAQNHAMAHAAVVQSAASKTYDTAMCIQQSQGGFIAADKYKLMILPFALREKALGLRKEQAFDKLWKSISEFNERMGAQASGHLEFFLEQFKSELDQFVAEFESVPRQVGAIVLIDGQVVGIERAPSQTYWLSIWPALIRECYGSLAIEYRRSMGDKAELSQIRIPLAGSVNSLEDIERLLREAEAREEELARNTVRSLIDDAFVREVEEEVEGFTLETLSHDQLCGQIVHEQGNVLYASLIVAERWKHRSPWRAAQPFTV